MSAVPAPPDELGELAGFPAGIDSDPLLTRKAGENGTFNDGGAIWIKASGTLPAEAETRDIPVAIDLEAKRECREDLGVDAGRSQGFVPRGSGLRSSIETSLNAVFDHRVVVHLHCMNTLAHALQQEAEEILTEWLAGFYLRLAPLVRPGAQLAARERGRLHPETGRPDFVIPGNSRWEAKSCRLPSR